MIEQLQAIHHTYQKLTEEIQAPDAFKDQKRYAQLAKKHKKLEKIINPYKEYLKKKEERCDLIPLLKEEKDPELIDMYKEEIKSLDDALHALKEKLEMLLVPDDPHSDKNVILEIRAGTGGGEAGIWAGDLFRMYKRLSEKKKWQIDVIDQSPSAQGGYKEIVAAIAGEEVYAMLRHESGIHRVQRVPATETQGRIHTSAASVAVLPEMDDVDVTIHMSEVKKETFCSSGPGGQSVNTTYSAVRLTHTPTGIVVSCQDGKSQIKNFEKALTVLRARLYERAQKEQQEALGKQRLSMVGSGDRSEKIRTYNFPQGRVTDHRIGYTKHNLQDFLAGDIGDLTQALRMAERTRYLQQLDTSKSS